MARTSPAAARIASLGGRDRPSLSRSLSIDGLRLGSRLLSGLVAAIYLGLSKAYLGSGLAAVRIVSGMANPSGRRHKAPNRSATGRGRVWLVNGSKPGHSLGRDAYRPQQRRGNSTMIDGSMALAMPTMLRDLAVADQTRQVPHPKAVRLLAVISDSQLIVDETGEYPCPVLDASGIVRVLRMDAIA